MYPNMLFIFTGDATITPAFNCRDPLDPRQDVWLEKIKNKVDLVDQ